MPPMSFDVFVRCRCGREVRVEVAEHPSWTGARFRCSVCGEVATEVAVWPRWQRAFRRGDWTPWPKERR